MPISDHILTKLQAGQAKFEKRNRKKISQAHDWPRRRGAGTRLLWRTEHGHATYQLFPRGRNPWYIKTSGRGAGTRWKIFRTGSICRLSFGK
jgi:hypothetical protein